MACSCGAQANGTNLGGALPCEPDTVRSRVTTSTYKGINPELWHHLCGERRSGDKVGVILLIPSLSPGSSSPLRGTRRPGTDSTLREGRLVISKGNRVSNTKWGLCCLN